MKYDPVDVALVACLMSLSRAQAMRGDVKVVAYEEDEEETWDDVMEDLEDNPWMAFAGDAPIIP